MFYFLYIAKRPLIRKFSGENRGLFLDIFRLRCCYYPKKILTQKTFIMIFDSSLKRVDLVFVIGKKLNFLNAKAILFREMFNCL